jgi:hypothetical protein
LGTTIGKMVSLVGLVGGQAGEKKCIL